VTNGTVIALDAVGDKDFFLPETKVVFAQITPNPIDELPRTNEKRMPLPS
jgi:hypothetical protein